MNTSTTENIQLQKAEASLYALLLDWGTRVGLVVLVLGFSAYVFGLITPFVPLADLPQLWNQPVAIYLQKTGTPTGWGWLPLVAKGDMLNLLGIALLAGCSSPPLLGLTALYIKRRDHAYAGICGGIVLVLVLAEVPVPVSALGWLPSAAAMPTAPTMPSAAAPMPPLAAAPADVAVAAALAGAADATVVPAGAVGSASAVGGVSVVNWVLCQAKSPIAGSALLSNSCGQSSA